MRRSKQDHQRRTSGGELEANHESRCSRFEELQEEDFLLVNSFVCDALHHLKPLRI